MRITLRGIKKSLELISEFLLDASVLVFVFPILDSLVQFGKKSLTRSLVGWSMGIALLFFGLAVIMGVVGEQLGESK